MHTRNALKSFKVQCKLHFDAYTPSNYLSTFQRVLNDYTVLLPHFKGKVWLKPFLANRVYEFPYTVRLYKLCHVSCRLRCLCVAKQASQCLNHTKKKAPNHWTVYSKQWPLSQRFSAYEGSRDFKEKPAAPWCVGSCLHIAHMHGNLGRQKTQDNSSIKAALCYPLAEP